MALDLGDLIGRLKVDRSSFDRGLDEGEKKWKGFSDHLSASSIALGAGITLAFTKAFDFISSSVTAASDLAETQSKVRQVFGGASKAIEEFAETADKAFGQTKQQALDGAATFAIFGKSAGLAGKDLSDFSLDMIKLASDLASFHNTSVEDAIGAIGAAMRGENEQIQRYGVLLNEAALETQALKMGIIKTTKEALTPQQKVLVAQAAILAQTKDAQGDFARTASGAANTQRVLTAEIGNQKVMLGEKLLPAYLKLLQVGASLLDWLTGSFIPALQDAAAWFKRNQEWAAPLAITLGTLAGIILTVSSAIKIIAFVTEVWAAAQAALDAAMLANPIGVIIIALVALAAGLVYAYKHSETFRKIVDGTWAAIKVGAKAMWTAIRPVLLFLVDAFKAVGQASVWLWQHALKPTIDLAVTAFQIWWQNIRSLAAVFIWLYMTIMAPTFEAIWTILKTTGEAFTWLWTVAIWPALKAIGDAAVWLWEHAISPAFHAIAGAASWIRDAWVSVFSGVSSLVSDVFGTAVNVAKAAINSLIELLNKAIGFINRNLVDSLNALPGVDFTHISTVPHLAGGGKVSPRAGGRAVVMGDGGEVEYGVPRSDMRQIIGEAVRSGGGGGVIEIVVMDEMRRVRKRARVQGGQSRGVPVLVGA